MTLRVVDPAAPVPPVPPVIPPSFPWKAIGVIFITMFIIGLAMGSCSLGMKLPTALYEWTTGRPAQ